MIVLMLLTTVLLLGASQVAELELKHETVCEDSDFQIVRKNIYLSEEQFTEERLTQYFQRFLDTQRGELYVTASSDLSFLQRVFSLPPTFLDPKLSRPIEIPIKTVRPLAYFYRIGPHAFYQFRSPTGAVRWVLLRGENIFETTFGTTHVTFAGQYFATSAGGFCRDTHRNLVLVARGISWTDRNQIVNILRFYDSALNYPPTLVLDIYGSFKAAGTYRRLVLPSLNGDLTPAASEDFNGGPSVHYMRLASGRRSLVITGNQGEPPIFDGTLSLDELYPPK